ncbi:MAG: hypothetical protein DMF90_06540 [Acidobacteria bacterium]|nr:MAG: hypothetical protein DMF90_06540 [Acidobacteriota bacterium]
MAVAGAVTALLVAAGAWWYERARFGATDEVATARVRTEVNRRFAQTAQSLGARLARVSLAREAIRSAARDTAAADRLFRILDDENPSDAGGSAGITVYDGSGAPLAWAGNVTDLARDRLAAPGVLFAAPGAPGLRLVRVEVLPDPDHPSGPPLASIAAEQLVEGTAIGSGSLADTFTLPTSIVDVVVRAHHGQAEAESSHAFAVRSPDGQVLAEAEVSPARLAEARQRFHALTRAWLLAVLIGTLLLAAGLILELRRHATRGPVFFLTTSGVLACLLAARLVFSTAAAVLQSPSTALALELIPNALLVAAVVWLALDTLERQRVAAPRRRLALLNTAGATRLALAYVGTGALTAGILWEYERILESVSARSTLDLLHFSLHPVDATRLGVAFGLLLLHAGVIWGAAVVLRVPSLLWRVPRSAPLGALTVVSCSAGFVATILALRQATATIPPLLPVVTAAAASGAAALLVARARPLRRASQAARLGAWLAALLLPALALYPSMNAFAAAAKEQLVATEFAPQAVRQREDLQTRRLPHSLESIDALPQEGPGSLAELVTSSADQATPTTDRAFLVWSQTELAGFRTTSAVELYGPNGRLVSRFALNLPEYGSTPYEGGTCGDWELYEEVTPPGSAPRYVLRASRAICQQRRRVGAIVVRAMLDYRALPFISTQSPYYESMRPSQRLPSEGVFGRDVEFALYGWSRVPIYTSGTSVWPLNDSVFDRTRPSASISSTIGAASTRSATHASRHSGISSTSAS